MDDDDPTLLHLWARVPGGFGKLAVAEVAAVVRPHQKPREHAASGRVTFAVRLADLAAPDGASQVAARICRLRTVEHVYACLADGSLQRSKLRRLARPPRLVSKVMDLRQRGALTGPDVARLVLAAQGAASPHEEGGGDLSLAAVRAGVAALRRQRVAAALQLRRAVAEARADGQPPPAPDSSVRVHVVAKRGGKHTFSSDDAKRAAAQGLKDSGLLSLGCRQSDATAFLHVHFGAWWLGLQLNHATLLDRGFLTKSRAQLIRELRASGDSEEERGDEAGEKQEQWLGDLCTHAGAAAEDQRSRDRRGVSTTERAVEIADDVICPLRGMPYTEQVEAKAQELRQLLVRAARRTRRLFSKRDGSPPDWLEAREDGALYLRWYGVHPHPLPRGWLDYVETANGDDGLGPRVSDQGGGKRRTAALTRVLPIVDSMALPDSTRAAVAAVQSCRLEGLQGAILRHGSSGRTGVLLRLGSDTLVLRRSDGTQVRVDPGWLAEQVSGTDAAPCPLSGMSLDEFEAERDRCCCNHPLPYARSQRVLVVGDGDFSWSRALVTRFGQSGTDGRRPGAGVVATTIDTREELLAKYPSAEAHLHFLESAGATVLFGVDCTQPAVLRGRGRFDVAVFNFPHTDDDNTGAGSRGEREAVAVNRALLRGYFSGISPLVRAGGELHCTLMRRHPYTQWNVNAQALVCPDLVPRRPAAFDFAAYPGYHHKQTNRAASARVTEAVTHRYVRGGPAPDDAQQALALEGLADTLRRAGVHAASVVPPEGGGAFPLYGCDEGSQWFPDETLCGCTFRSPEPFRCSRQCAEEMLSHVLACCARECGDADPSFPPPPTTPLPQHTAGARCCNRLLDVCTGGGTVAVAHAVHTGAPVVGVDRSTAALATAARNAAANGVAEACVFAEADAGDLAKVLSGGDAAAALSGGDVVCVVDPPRTGLPAKAFRAIREHPRMRRVVYVSRNPLALSDRWDYVTRKGAIMDHIEVLCGPGAAPFRPTSAAGFDVLPHSPQADLVLVFDR